MSWIPIAFEVAKGVLGIIVEAVGASAEQLEELGERFDNLMKVGIEELTDARKASADATTYTNERRDAALARIRAARIAQAATTPVGE